MTGRLNLPREQEMERDPPGEDVRDLSGGYRFGSVSDKQGGTVTVGAPEWRSTEVDQVGHFRLLRSPVVRGQELQWVWMIPRLMGQNGSSGPGVATVSTPT